MSKVNKRSQKNTGANYIIKQAYKPKIPTQSESIILFLKWFFYALVAMGIISLMYYKHLIKPKYVPSAYYK